MVFAYGFSFNMILRFSVHSSSGFCEESSCTMLKGFFGSLGFSRFCLGLYWTSCTWEGCSYSWGSQLCSKCHTDHLTCRKHFQFKCRNGPRAYRNKFQNVQSAYIKQSNSRDVSEGFDDTVVFIVGDARSPALGMMMVSHFALASSLSLRVIELFNIILGLKFLKKQNSCLDLIAFIFIFSYQRKLRNFLNTMTSRHDL